MPEITFPSIDINKAATEVNNALKEGAYVAVGLGVLGFQRAQVQRVELTKQLSTLPDTINSQVEAVRKRWDETFGPVRAQLAKTVPAGASSEAIEGQLETARAQLVEFAKTFDARVQPARKQLDERIDRLEQHLPAGARSVVHSVRAAAATPEQALRTAVGLD